MASDAPVLVQDPAGDLRVKPLELPKDLADRRALDRHLAVAPRQILERCPQLDDRHGSEPIRPPRRSAPAGPAIRRRDPLVPRSLARRASPTPGARASRSYRRPPA